MPNVKFKLELGEGDEKPEAWRVTLNDQGPIIIDPAVGHEQTLNTGLHRFRMLIEGEPKDWVRLTITRPGFKHDSVHKVAIPSGASDSIKNRGFRV